MSEAQRGWAYRVLFALVAVGAIYGVFNQEQVLAWGAVIAALLGNGLATLNTTVKPPPEPPAE